MMKGDRARAGRVLGKIAPMVLACLLTVAARPAEHPLSKDDVTLLLIGGATAEKMMALIEKRGVDFQMNPDLAKKFHDNGADDAVIEALTKAGLRFAAGTSVAPASPAVGTAPTPATPNPSTPSPTTGQTQPTAVPSRPASSSVEQKIAEALAVPTPSEGPRAPAFSLVDLSGKKLELADYGGKVVLLDFWATWCQPCRTEIPEFMRLQKRYGDQGFQVLGISVDDSPRTVRKFYQDYNLNYPVALVNARVRQLYDGVRAVPTTLLIGRDGRIYDKVVGAPVDLTFLSKEIRMLLEATTPGTTEQVASAKPPTAASPAKASESPANPGGTPVASAAPHAAPKVNSSVDLSDPSPDQIQHIIQEFAAKEKLFREARDNYTYHQINKVQELDADGNVAGMYEQDWDIVYNDAGQRIEQVTYAPPDTLKGLIVTQEDLNSMRNIQPFVLTTEELPQYDIKYLGHVKVDEITAYVFSIRPKEITKGHLYFQGIVWVDDRDLQIVKTEGKTVPELRAKKGQFNLFPRFTTYREQIDGKFWFPTFTIADDTLYFPEQPVHMKEIIKYADYKQFKATSNIRVVQEIPVDKPKGPSNAEPARNAAPKR